MSVNRMKPVKICLTTRLSIVVKFDSKRKELGLPSTQELMD